MASGKDLVIVTAGDASSHTGYAAGREFDLWVAYYGADDSKAQEYACGCDRVLRRRGLKWEIIRSFIVDHLAGDVSPFEKYRYILIPDDDLFFPNGAADIHNLFGSAAILAADIFQPAIRNQNFSIAWEATRLIPNGYCHAVNIVELMAPGYSGTLFSRVVLPILQALEFQRAGWGIEPVIARFGESHLRRPVRTFVLDNVPMDHLRPVGTGTTPHEIGEDEAFLTPMVYSNRMREYARFDSAEAGRAFQFPFLLGNSDRHALEGHMAAVRQARLLLNAFLRSRQG